MLTNTKDSGFHCFVDHMKANISVAKPQILLNNSAKETTKDSKGNTKLRNQKMFGSNSHKQRTETKRVSTDSVCIANKSLLLAKRIAREIFATSKSGHLT